MSEMVCHYRAKCSGLMCSAPHTHVLFAYCKDAPHVYLHTERESDSLSPSGHSRHMEMQVWIYFHRTVYLFIWSHTMMSGMKRDTVKYSIIIMSRDFTNKIVLQGLTLRIQVLLCGSCFPVRLAEQQKMMPLYNQGWTGLLYSKLQAAPFPLNLLLLLQDWALSTNRKVLSQLETDD